jgi:hypothetical protein
MSFTKAQARSAVAQAIDDPNFKRWTSANLDVVIAMAVDDGWSQLLETNPYYTSQLQTFSSITSPGYVDLRLIANGGALSQRFQKVQKVTRDGREFSLAKQQELLLEGNADLSKLAYRYIFFGDQLWLFPLETNLSIELRYSFKPPSFISLGENDTVAWPEGHESAYVYEAAARAIGRGNAEEMTNFMSIAQMSQKRAENAIKRQYYGALMMDVDDAPTAWGAEND